MLGVGAVRHHALLLLLLLSATATRTTMSMPLPLLLLLSLLLPPPPLLLPWLLLLLHLAQPRHAVVAAVFERVEVDVGAEGQEADHQAVDQLSGRARGLEEDGQARDRQLRSGSRCAALVRRREGQRWPTGGRSLSEACVGSGEGPRLTAALEDLKPPRAQLVALD